MLPSESLAVNHLLQLLILRQQIFHRPVAARHGRAWLTARLRSLGDSPTVTSRAGRTGYNGEGAIIAAARARLGGGDNPTLGRGRWAGRGRFPLTSVRGDFFCKKVVKVLKKMGFIYRDVKNREVWSLSVFGSSCLGYEVSGQVIHTITWPFFRGLQQ